MAQERREDRRQRANQLRSRRIRTGNAENFPRVQNGLWKVLRRGHQQPGPRPDGRARREGAWVAGQAREPRGERRHSQARHGHVATAARRRGFPGYKLHRGHEGVEQVELVVRVAGRKLNKKRFYSIEL